ncbi:hypothetical protein BDF22DRAFT_745983 [Syncephalis plumigaleata]|nr:hypothetical protein BDF22DRAFT_745983 [Syncephalis plumigaleata]
MSDYYQDSRCQHHLHAPSPKCPWSIKQQQQHVNYSITATTTANTNSSMNTNTNNDAQAWWLDLLSHALEAQNTASAPSSKRSSLRAVGSPTLPSIQESTEKRNINKLSTSTSTSSSVVALSSSMVQAESNATSPTMDRFPSTEYSSCTTSGVTSIVTTPADELLDSMNQHHSYNSLGRMMFHDKLNPTASSSSYEASYFWPRVPGSRTLSNNDTLPSMPRATAYQWKQKDELDSEASQSNTIIDNHGTVHTTASIGDSPLSSPLSKNVDHTLARLCGEEKEIAPMLSDPSSFTIKTYTEEEAPIVLPGEVSASNMELPSPMRQSTCIKGTQVASDNLTADKHEIHTCAKAASTRWRSSIRKNLKHMLYSMTPGASSPSVHSSRSSSSSSSNYSTAAPSSCPSHRRHSHQSSSVLSSINNSFLEGRTVVSQEMNFNDEHSNAVKHSSLIDASTSSSSLNDENMAIAERARQFIEYARSKQQQHFTSHSTSDNDLERLSSEHLPQLQPSTTSTSCTPLSTPRNSQEHQSSIIINNDPICESRKSRATLFRRLTAKRAATDTELHRQTSMSSSDGASNDNITQSTSSRTVPKLKRSSSLLAIKDAIRRASSVRQVLRTTIQRQEESTPAPAPLVVSDPIVRGGTCGVVDRRHPSRNEWLRSQHAQDRKVTFLQHVQDGEKVLAQRPGIKRAATIMVQRTKHRNYQTNTLYVGDNDVGPSPVQRSASLSAVHVNRGNATRDRLQRMRSLRHPRQLNLMASEREQQQHDTMISRLCAAGFILSATHPETSNDSDNDSDHDDVKFNFCNHDNEATCTFLCNESYSVPTTAIRVSYNKSRLVQLLVPQKISLVNLKTRIENKFRQCGILDTLEGRQLIYTDADSCAVMVDNQKLLDAILSMADDGPLAFRLA